MSYNGQKQELWFPSSLESLSFGPDFNQRTTSLRRLWRGSIPELEEFLEFQAKFAVFFLRRPTFCSWKESLEGHFVLCFSLCPGKTFWHLFLWPDLHVLHGLLVRQIVASHPPSHSRRVCFRGSCGNMSTHHLSTAPPPPPSLVRVTERKCCGFPLNQPPKGYPLPQKALDDQPEVRSWPKGPELRHCFQHASGKSPASAAEPQPWLSQPGCEHQG